MFAKLYSWYSSSWGLSIPFLIIIMTSTSCSYHHHDHQPNLLLIRTSTSFFQGQHQLSRKSEKNKSFWPNQSAPFIYIMIERCYFSLDQWEIRIHLLWGECFNIPHHCDPHLNQTKFNDLLPLTIDGVLKGTLPVVLKKIEKSVLYFAKISAFQGWSCPPARSHHGHHWWTR